MGPRALSSQRSVCGHMKWLVSFSALISVVMSWGPLGHSLIGSIAQTRLTPRAQHKVRQILSESRDPTLAGIASWADQIKGSRTVDYSWAAQLHFVNTKSWACKFTPVVDCPKPGSCVVDAIANYSQRLAINDKQVQSEALKFLVHFVGDVHQPLHVAFKDDRGGNNLRGNWAGFRGSLHALWDAPLLRKRIDVDFQGRPVSYEKYLLGLLDTQFKNQLASWTQCDSNDGCFGNWASEAAKIACDVAYKDSAGKKLTNGFKLDEPYFKRALPVLDEIILKGGVRLADILNRALA